MSKHTPGPWYVESDFQIVAGTDDDSPLVATVADNHWKQNWKEILAANAALIAAAPEMLEALKKAFEYINKCPICETVADEIAFAIAKAEGRDE